VDIHAHKKSMTPDIQKKIDDFMLEIGEHFESVRFFGTYSEDNNETSAYTVGYGNFYAQLGHIHEWTAAQDEIRRAHTRKTQDDDPEK
jgi:hypothetical protein